MSRIMVFKRKKRVVFASVAVLVLVGSLALAFYFKLWRPADPEAAPRLFVVEQGWALPRVAGELEQAGIIADRRAFRLWARLKGAGGSIRAGEYNIGPNMSPAEILEELTSGSVVTHVVTVPEGYTVDQIAALLEAKGLVSSRSEITALLEDKGLMEAYELPGPTLEGYLYPDTYYFARGLRPRRMVEEMIRRFLEVARPLREHAAERGMDLKELVILASIVEKETGLASERPVIASVFLNRLDRGMRLESDPTVIYGLSEFDGNLTRKDLETPTSYNTYEIRGLPPGPIANPGIDSMKAVLDPADTDYLYFVSRNDGSHHFSRTLAEHNRAVWKYQKGGG